MEFEAVFSPDADRVEISVSGEVGAADFVARTAEVMADPRWRGGMDVIIRFVTGADLTDFTLENYRDRMAPVREAVHEKYGDAGRKAWVVEDDMTRPVIQMWELGFLKDADHQFRIFATMADARRWLDAPAAR